MRRAFAWRVAHAATMPATKIMIIRHAEKPVDGGAGGVRPGGGEDDASLSVMGWQRAGALVRFFSRPDAAGIAVPQHLVAAGHDGAIADTSRRAKQTLRPLGRALGLAIDDRFVKGQEKQAAALCLGLDGVVLVAWAHESIAPLLAALGTLRPTPPRKWPDARFDVVWVLDAEAGARRWAFSQVAQQLLAGDRDRGIDDDR